MAGRELGSPKHAKQIDTPIMADADEAQLVDLLEAKLPPHIFQRLMSRVEGVAEPSARLAYLAKVALRIGTYVEITEEANYIISVGTGRVDIHSKGAVQKDLSLDWTVLTHVALTAGWVRIGYTRLERNRAERGGSSSDPAEISESRAQSRESAAARKESQVELIVAYEADGARFMSRIHGEELLEFRLDGQVVDPPAPTLDGIYRWLGSNGYVPDIEQFKWLDRHEGRRRRRQVYVYRPREVTPERRLSHAQAWDVTRGYKLTDL